MKTVFQKMYIIPLFLLTFNILFAQNEGVIEYTIVDVSMPDMKKSEKMNADMFKNMMKMQLTFSKKMSKMSVTVMGGVSKTETFIDNEKKQSFTLMDVMDKKYKIVDNSVVSDEKRKEIQDNLDINYNTLDRKKILNFDCYSVTVKLKDIVKYQLENGNQESRFGKKKQEDIPKEIIIKAYITDEIAPNLLTMSNLGDKVKGMALEYQMDMQKMKFVMQATKFEKSVPKDAFVVPDGYEEITKEEFEKRMKGF